MYKAKNTRPPSSYGSMKSDTDEEEGQDQESSVFSVVLPTPPGLMDMGYKCHSSVFNVVVWVMVLKVQTGM